ncbi:MAG: hypothetical protein ACFFCS_28065 [Candidatus Hodarchaeota archaeon]
MIKIDQGIPEQAPKVFKTGFVCWSGKIGMDRVRIPNDSIKRVTPSPCPDSRITPSPPLSSRSPSYLVSSP